MAESMPRRMPQGVLLAAGAAAVLTVSFALTPAGLPGFSICWFKHLAGLPCPGCGLTHAFCAISHGRFDEAWGYNPFGYLFYAAAIFLVAWPWLDRRWPSVGRFLLDRRVSLWGSISLVAVMWAFGLWRMFASG